MLFAAAMIVPLYYGAKKLLGRQGALVLTAFYVFFPLYLDYTRFLWNPNFQFSLVPLIILSMGLHEQTKKLRYFLLTSVLLGVILQFHYQFVLVIAGVFLYYFVIRRQPLEDILFFLFGLAVGVSPLILFELRNHFYNTNTVLLLLQHHNQVIDPNAKGSIPPHYFLSVSFFVLLACIAIVRKKITWSIACFIVIVLALTACIKYVPSPTHAFGMVPHWNIRDDEKTYEIITHSGATHYNIVNLSYDTLAVVQKFFHQRDGRVFAFDDYYTNQNLFVVSADDQYFKNPAYEVNTFQPSTVVNKWQINSTYTLYLLHRDLPKAVY